MQPDSNIRGLGLLVFWSHAGFLSGSISLCDSDTDTETEEWITGFIQITCWFRQNEKKKWNKVQVQFMPRTSGLLAGEKQSFLNSAQSSAESELE